ncbi:transcriptional activator xlnR [Ilyonectria destructans]|nr:transcriptional activator xlnR [Ilyonectria destructans]
MIRYQVTERCDPQLIMTAHQRESPSVTAQPYQHHARARKRIKQACDQCGLSRARCNGGLPCSRCQEYGKLCVYNREVKKRGRRPGSMSLANRSTRRSKSPNPSLLQKDDASGMNGRPILRPRTSEENRLPSPCHPPDADCASLQPGEYWHLLGDGANTSDIASTTDQHDLHSVLSTSYDLTAILGNNPSSPLAPAEEAAKERTVNTTEREVIATGSNSSPTSSRQENTGHKSSPSELHAGCPWLPLARNRGSDFSYPKPAPSGLMSEPPLVNQITDQLTYPFINPVLPLICDIVSKTVACELLDTFLSDPGTSLFRCPSPYILSRIFRRNRIIHPTNPRPTSPALIATILWAVAQTADLTLLRIPGSRARIVNGLYDVVISLISHRDTENWSRAHGDLGAERNANQPLISSLTSVPATASVHEVPGGIDDVLTFTLLAIVVSGGDFKSNSEEWWSKATRLALSLGLNCEVEDSSTSYSNVSKSCQGVEAEKFRSVIEYQEERRRVFWLLYSLDRHLALSFNSPLSIPDRLCRVYTPLPEVIWENLESVPLQRLQVRSFGPPVIASGSGFFEYFLPLMAILGDIIEIHHQQHHPRLHGNDDTGSLTLIQECLNQYQASLAQLEEEISIGDQSDRSIATGSTRPHGPNSLHGPPTLEVAKAYGSHIVHVLYVLLYGKWDVISMIDDDDDWITSERFNKCASHAIAASQSIWTILSIDPELTFMPYLFGIYLLHGSFIFLLFAEKMPQLGPNESVEHACEGIIRAHEVCVVTLSTEFQKTFRKVLRSTLYSVRSQEKSNLEDRAARRRALSLYRWTPTARGLCL